MTINKNIIQNELGKYNKLNWMRKFINFDKSIRNLRKLCNSNTIEITEIIKIFKKNLPKYGSMEYNVFSEIFKNTGYNPKLPYYELSLINDFKIDKLFLDNKKSDNLLYLLKSLKEIGVLNQDKINFLLTQDDNYYLQLNYMIQSIPSNYYKKEISDLLDKQIDYESLKNISSIFQSLSSLKYLLNISISHLMQESESIPHIGYILKKLLLTDDLKQRSITDILKNMNPKLLISFEALLRNLETHNLLNEVDLSIFVSEYAVNNNWAEIVNTASKIIEISTEKNSLIYCLNKNHGNLFKISSIFEKYNKGQNFSKKNIMSFTDIGELNTSYSYLFTEISKTTIGESCKNLLMKKNKSDITNLAYLFQFLDINNNIDIDNLELLIFDAKLVDDLSSIVQIYSRINKQTRIVKNIKDFLTITDGLIKYRKEILDLVNQNKISPNQLKILIDHPYMSYVFNKLEYDFNSAMNKIGAINGIFNKLYSTGFLEKVNTDNLNQLIEDSSIRNNLLQLPLDKIYADNLNQLIEDSSIRHNLLQLPLDKINTDNLNQLIKDSSIRDNLLQLPLDKINADNLNQLIKDNSIRHNLLQLPLNKLETNNLNELIKNAHCFPAYKYIIIHNITTIEIQRKNIAKINLAIKLTEKYGDVFKNNSNEIINNEALQRAIILLDDKKKEYGEMTAEKLEEIIYNQELQQLIIMPKFYLLSMDQKKFDNLIKNSSLVTLVKMCLENDQLIKHTKIFTIAESDAKITNMNFIKSHSSLFKKISSNTIEKFIVDDNVLKFSAIFIDRYEHYLERINQKNFNEIISNLDNITEFSLCFNLLDQDKHLSGVDKDNALTALASDKNLEQILKEIQNLNDTTINALNRPFQCFFASSTMNMKNDQSNRGGSSPVSVVSYNP
ncbi:MAG: hypothetical protein EP298_01970 [Gammaproteobacteria bacterium]|nr:MAG: hypothetical protein EP298_01970 [Gammaproteobacteria bacterium]UTW42443.1 hypothetical protein KFE69_13355 [bacterium SCSIO 12844]